ncbi:MAG: hypothetical protein R2695_02685 [Acidimicrobiales bacterium]
MLDGRRVAELALNMLYQEAFLRYLPVVVVGLDRREPVAATWLARNGARLVVQLPRTATTRERTCPSSATTGCRPPRVLAAVTGPSPMR